MLTGWHAQCPAVAAESGDCTLEEVRGNHTRVPGLYACNPDIYKNPAAFPLAYYFLFAIVGICGKQPYST